MVTLYFDPLSSPQLLDFQQNRLDPRKRSLAACGTVENLAKGAVRSGWTKQNESGTIMWRGSWPQIFWRPGENPTYLFSATTCGGRCRVYHPWPLETSDLCRVRASTRERWWVGLKSQPLVSTTTEQPANLTKLTSAWSGREEPRGRVRSRSIIPLGLSLSCHSLAEAPAKSRWERKQSWISP